MLNTLENEALNDKEAIETDTPESTPGEVVDEGQQSGNETAESVEESPEINLEALGKVLGQEGITLEELKKDRLRHADYTRKRQADSAEMRKFQEEAQAKSQKLDSLIAEIEAVTNGEFANVNWDHLRDSDPHEYARLDQLKQSRAALLEKAKADKEANHNAIVAKESEALNVAMGWDDPVDGEEKQKADIAVLQKYTKDVPQAVWENLIDHNVMTLLIDGAKRRDMLSRKPAELKQSNKAPATTKPGGKATTARPKTLAERLYGK